MSKPILFSTKSLLFCATMLLSPLSLAATAAPQLNVNFHNDTGVPVKFMLKKAFSGRVICTNGTHIGQIMQPGQSILLGNYGYCDFTTGSAYFELIDQYPNNKGAWANFSETLQASSKTYKVEKTGSATSFQFSSGQPLYDTVNFYIQPAQF